MKRIPGTQVLDRADPITVVGAGMAGLAAATALAETGQPVRVFEAAPRAGGRARSFDDARFGHVDNGQHLVMACYYEMLAFLRRIGVSDEKLGIQARLSVAMVEPGGARVGLHAPDLPAPLDLAAALARFRGASAPARARALAFALALKSGWREPKTGERCAPWLARNGQRGALSRALWHPLIWATLNEDPEYASAESLHQVLYRAMFAENADPRLGFPRVGMSELYVDPAIEHLERHGAELHFAAPVRSVHVEDGRVVGIVDREGKLHASRRVIVAVPPHSAHRMMPDAYKRHAPFDALERLGTSPIVNLWARVDRIPFDEAFVGLLDSPIHWLFARDRDAGVLTATISGAKELVEQSADALRHELEEALRRYFPGRRVEVLAFRAIKEKHATIAQTPATQARRPFPSTPIDGLWFAGDWVATGLPATLESAAQSGHDAATLALNHRSRGAAANESSARL